MSLGAEKVWLIFINIFGIFGQKKSRNRVISQSCSPEPTASACASSAHPWPTAAGAPWRAGDKRIKIQYNWQHFFHGGKQMKKSLH